MLYTLLFSVVFIFIAIALLAIKMIIQKNGKFPNTHISGNKALKKKGVSCARSTDDDERKKKKLQDFINDNK